MPNWRRYVREPAITAVAVIGLALVVSIAAIVPSGDLGYLLPALIGIVAYGLAIAVVWVGLTAVFSWLLRRRQPWWSIVAGGCASLLIAAAGLAPLVLRLVATEGWGGSGAQLAIGSAAGAIVATVIIHTVVHRVLRSRHRSEDSAELG